MAETKVLILKNPKKSKGKGHVPFEASDDAGKEGGGVCFFCFPGLNSCIEMRMPQAWQMHPDALKPGISRNKCRKELVAGVAQISVCYGASKWHCSACAPLCCKNPEKKKEPKPKLFGPDIFGKGGGRYGLRDTFFANMAGGGCRNSFQDRRKCSKTSLFFLKTCSPVNGTP